jgi:hypothetical protein
LSEPRSIYFIYSIVSPNSIADNTTDSPEKTKGCVGTALC